MSAGFWRVFRRDRTTAWLAVAAIALGTMAATLVFAAAYGTLLRPLPYPDASRLVTLTDHNPAKNLSGQRLPPARYLEWQQATDVFEDVGAFDTFEQNLTGLGEPERARIARVTPELLELTGVVPVLGRLISGDDPCVMVSHPFWERHLSSADLTGRVLRLDGRTLEIVGVMPASFGLPAADVYLPLPLVRTSRVARHLHVVARLAERVDLAAARARAADLSRRAEAAHPDTDGGWTTSVTPIRDALAGDAGPALRLLLAAAALVALIACASVANLLLVRFVARRRELAVRVALGATRMTVAVTLAAEGALIGLAGALAGLLLAWMAAPLAAAGRLDIALPPVVAAFAVIVGLGIGLLAGVSPVVAFLRVDPMNTLTDGGRTATSASTRRLGSVAVVLQVATAVVLTSGASLLVASLAKLHAVNPGFRTSGVLTTRVSLPRTRYRSGDDLRRFERAIIDELSALPGVEASGLTSVLPLSGRNARFNVSVRGRPASGHSDLPTAEIRSVSPGYFDTMGIPLLAGRQLERTDSADAPAVVVINETMARQVWPGQSPVGERISFEGPEGPWLEIVGVMGDVKHDALAAPFVAEMYRPFSQEPWPAATLVARTGRKADWLVPALRGAVRAVDRELAPHDTRTIESLVAESLWRPRLWTTVLAGFGILALVLALTSVFGVVAHSVRHRIPEIALRLALGATPEGIVRMILGEGLRLVLTGAVAGLAASWTLAGVLSPLMFGVGPRDPAVFASASALLVAGGLASSYWPARRASRVGPMVALRHL